MKQLILAFLLGILLTGCEKDSVLEESNDLSQLENTHISIDELVSFINQQYKENKSVVFVDGLGDSIKYDVYFGLSTADRTEFGINYTHDYFVVRLTPSDNLGFGFEIWGQGIYSQRGETQKRIGVYFDPRTASVTNFVDVSFENGVAIVSENDNFFSTLMLNGRAFRDVYSSHRFLTGAEAYSDIKFNASEGIVSYKDGNGRSWFFERFEP